MIGEQIVYTNERTMFAGSLRSAQMAAPANRFTLLCEFFAQFTAVIFD